MSSEADDPSEAAWTRRTIRRVGAVLVLTVAIIPMSFEAANPNSLPALFQMGSAGYLLGSLVLQGFDALPGPDHSTEGETAD